MNRGLGSKVPPTAHSVHEKEAKKIQREMDKLYRLYMADEISKEGFGSNYRPLEDRLKQLEEEKPEIQAELDFLKIQHLSSEQILSDAKDLFSRWPKLDFESKWK